MLMHCVNNALAVFIGKFGSDKVADAKSILEVIPAWEYAVLFVLSGAFIWFLINYLKTIELQDPQGNCDVIEEVH